MTLTIANIQAQLRDLANQDVWDLAGAGAPSNGTTGTGAGLAGKASSYRNVSAGTIYYNTNTKASPTWTLGTNSSLGTGVGTFLATPSSANLLAALTTSTGTGLAVFGTAPVLTFAAQSVAAAGSAQNDAAAITATAPGNVLATAADGTKGVILPAAVAGKTYNVKNSDAANAVLKVYPATGETINAITANAAISMAAKTSAVFMCVVTGAWLTVPLVPS